MTSLPLIQYYSIDTDLLQDRLFLASIPDNFGFSHGRLIVGSHEQTLDVITRGPIDWKTRYVAELLRTRLVSVFARQSPHINPVRLSLHPAEAAIHFAERHLMNRVKNVGNWHVPSTVEFRRDPEALTELLAPILYDAPEIAVIDPEFRVDGGSQARKGNRWRFVIPFRRILDRWMETNSGEGEFTIYTARKPDLFNAWRDAPGNVPDRVKVTPLPLESGEPKQHHNRFVLSARGGVFLGWGMDAAGAAGQLDVAARIDEEHANLLKQRFPFARAAR